MNNDLNSRFLKALESHSHYDSLLAFAKELKTEGISQTEIYDLFAAHFKSLNNRDSRYDSIADIMDLIHSGPWAKGQALFDTELKRA